MFPSKNFKGVNLGNVRPSLTIIEVEFDDIYLIEADVDISSLSLNHEEVRQVKWATRKKILSMIDSKEFIQYHKSFVELLFDMQKYRGKHQDKL